MLLANEQIRRPMPYQRTSEQYRRQRANYLAKPENREKNRAREVCQAAIKSGKLTRQSCEKCGNVKTHAHHDDYSKPLDVRWLCHACHMAHHRDTSTVCRRGHEFSPENTLIDKAGIRRCIKCREAKRKAWLQLQRSKRNSQPNPHQATP